MPEPDPDSDRPEWAGGNTDANTHSKGNDDSGTKKGGDYGDLYIILRSLEVGDEGDVGSGVPIMVEIAGEWYVQPLDEFEEVLERWDEESTDDEELWGELVDSEAAITVEFGRLNIVRSPESVLDQAFDEAMKTLNPDGTTTIDVDIRLDFCGRLSAYTLGEDGPGGDGEIIKTIDSPRENMALYKYVMNNGFTEDLEFLQSFTVLDPLLVAASCFAAGSDKTGTVNVDEVVYIDGFMECVGSNPILNAHEYDKEYFNFSDFQYNRGEVYDNRYIQDTRYYPPDENGNSEGPVYSIGEWMEDHGGEENGFTNMWAYGNGNAPNVVGYAIAVDDAVQVLEWVHGDTNLRYVDADGNPL